MTAHTNKYDPISQLLHWSMVALLLAQWGLAEYAEYFANQNHLSGQLQTLALHKSLGMTLLVLLFIRAMWRLTHPHPAWPNNMPNWQLTAAKATHYLLYLLILALPITGWLGSSASAYSVSWFGIFQWPDLIPAEPTTKKLLYNIHEWLWNALLIIVLLHITAALKHHFWDKDNVLSNMLQRFGITIFLLTLIASTSMAVLMIQPNKNAQTITLPQTTIKISQPETKLKNLSQAWDIDYANSYIRFTADQEGAKFDGAFKQWTAQIHLDKTTPEDGFIDVEIDLASVNTQDEERDGLLKDPEFFAIAQFPKAHFTSQQIQIDPTHPTNKPILVDAILNLRGHQAPLKFHLSISEKAGQYELLGEAIIDRLIWQIGTGEWADISTIGQHVTVAVKVVTHKP